jgi:hypothetical protein
MPAFAQREICEKLQSGLSRFEPTSFRIQAYSVNRYARVDGPEVYLKEVKYGYSQLEGRDLSSDNQFICY